MRVKDNMTTSQVADLCHVSTRTVTKWFDRGLIKGFKVPGTRHRRYPKAEVLRFMQEHSIPIPAGMLPPPPPPPVPSYYEGKLI